MIFSRIKDFIRWYLNAEGIRALFRRSWRHASVAWPAWSRHMFLAGVVGLFCGLLSSALYFGLHFCFERIFCPALGIAPGLTQGPLRPFAILLLPSLAGLAAGWLLSRFSPESAGGGTEAVIQSFHFGEGKIPARVIPFKTLATALTVGLGHSGGSEGPVCQVAAAAGSQVAGLLGLTASERRILLTAGMAGGIGSIFRCPLGGALFACEVYYTRPDMETEAVVPSLISSVMAYTVFGLIWGFNPLLDGNFTFSMNWVSMVAMTGLALAAAFSSQFYTRFVARAKIELARFSLPARLGIAGLLTGGLVLGLWAVAATLGGPRTQGLAFAGVGEGYEILRQSVQGNVAVWLVAGVLAVKFLASGLSQASGAPVGAFAPSMVMGGCLGALVSAALQAAHVPGSDGPAWILLGMAGLFAANFRAPVSSVVIISEVAQGYQLLPGLMWVAALAYLIGPEKNLFHNQLRSRADSPASRQEMSDLVLARFKAGQVLVPASKALVLMAGDSLEKVRQQMAESRQEFFPVVDKNGKYVGGVKWRALTQEDLADGVIAFDLAEPAPAPLRPADGLGEALKRLTEQEIEELPVVDGLGHYHGLISRRQIWIHAMER